MNYSIREIEDAIVNQLAGGKLDVLFPGVTIDRYYGEITQELVEQASMGRPSALVMFGGERYRDLDSGHTVFDATASYTVIMIHSDLRGKRETMGESAQQPGLYDMAYEVRRCLAGNNLGLTIDALRPSRIEVFRVTSSVSMFLFEFEFDHEYDRSSET